MAKVDIEIRGFEPEQDVAFVARSWRKSAQEICRLPGSVFWSRFGYSGLVDYLLGTSEVLVASPSGHPELIAGWAAFGRDRDEVTLHWVYVKEDWRDQGVARDLLAPVHAAAGSLRMAVPPMLARGYHQGEKVGEDVLQGLAKIWPKAQRVCPFAQINRKERR